MSDPLAQLAEVTHALYLRERRRIAALIAEESELRRQLTQLRVQIGAGNAALSEGDATMQATGAEILWQAWSTRSRDRLERDLAIVLAKKRLVLDDVRRAFGRQEAVGAMRAEARRARLNAVQKAQLRRLLGQ